MPEKIRIEKNSVQETLLIPLYSRVQCTRLYPEIYSDPLSEEALGRIDYPFKETVKKDSMIIRFGALEAAMRQYDVKEEVQDYLKEHPDAAVVNLGCGLDPLTKYLDNGTCRLYNIDFPDVIETRNEIFPAGKAALKMMIKSVVENSAGIEGIDAYFHAGRPKKDIVPWIGDARVTYKGYMLGYSDLRIPGVSGMFRLLSKIGDGPMKMKIVKIGF